MKAVLLVGGYGLRMRPLTYVVPKCMLPIGGEPLLQRTIRYLKGYGINEFVICVAYLKKQIMDQFGDGSGLGVDIKYAQADFPLGTAGQLKTSEPFIKGSFVAMNGDIVTSLNIAKLVDFHKTTTPFASIALKKFDVKIPYGYINVEPNQRITGFQEKPTLHYLANAGVYVLEPAVFDYIPPEKSYSLETDVFPRLIKEGRQLSGYFEDASWADVGSLVDFERVDNELMAAQKSGLDSASKQGVIATGL